MKKIKISLCIPIFNRAKDLEKLLKSLNIEDSNLNLEIIISDNNSNDNIIEIIKKYEKIFKNFKYIKNNKNMGFDYNLQNAIEQSTGEYIWLMGSDDILTKNSLKNLIKELEENINIYILNGKVKINNELKNRDGLKNIKENKKYLNLENNLSLYINDIENDISLLFAFISSIVIKRELYLKTKIPNNIKNSSYDHMYKILKIIEENKNINLKYLHDYFYIAGENKNEWNSIKGKHFFLDITSMYKFISNIYKNDFNKEKEIKQSIGKLFNRNSKGLKKIFNIYYAKENNVLEELQKCYKYFEIYNFRVKLIEKFLANVFIYKFLFKMKKLKERFLIF